MSWIGRQVRRLGIGLAAFAALLLILHLVTRAPGQDLAASPEREIPIWVLDHGYHSGLIVSTGSLRRAALELGREDAAAGHRLRWLANLYPAATWLELGWGDADFYQQTPGIGDVDVLEGLRALVWPTEAALQSVPGAGPPEEAFRGAQMVRLEVTPEGLAGVAARLAETIPEPPPSEWLGPSLYGTGAFYASDLDYHLFRTCNHWLAWLLRGAGVPVSPVPATFSTTLMMELRWRAGLP